MKNLFKNAIFGKDTRLNGVLALLFIAAVALGCTCDDLGKQDGTERDRASNERTSGSYDDDRPSEPEKPKVEPADASTGEVPTDAQSQELARTTILDFHDAVSRGDFSDFRAKVSKPFQDSASVGKFEEVFKPFIDIKPDFSDVRTLTASFDGDPAIEREKGYKTLRLQGRYNLSPRPLKFDLKYIPEGKDWKLIYIEVNTK